MAVEGDQTLAVFALDNGKAAKRFLQKIQVIDKADTHVRILDAAIAERTRLGRVKIHQTMDRGGMKGGVRAGTIGVVVGAIVAGPAGAAVLGTAGAALGGVHNRLHDVGIDDKFMRAVGKEIEKRKGALFVQYEGNWQHSLGAIEDLVKAEKATLIHSTLPAEKAAQLRALVEPVVEQVGGEETMADFEVEVEVKPDDLTQLAGVGSKAAAALTAGGISTYKALSEANEPQMRRALADGKMNAPASMSTWPTQAEYAANGDWAGLMKYNQKRSAKKGGGKAAKSSGAKAAATAAAAAAAAAAAKPVEPDDLTKLSGIGARMEVILGDGDVKTYDKLAHTSTKDLRLIVAAGGALPPSALATWPTQAAYAAKGDWDGLAAYNKRH